MSENVANHVFSALRSNQRKAIEALLTGADKDEAADVAGVTRRTVDRWHNEPDFRAALEQATGDAIGDMARLLVGGMTTAAAVIFTLAEAEDAPPTVRLRASIAILEYGPKLFEAHELEDRVRALEQRLNEKS